jgi:hypothetical protein
MVNNLVRLIEKVKVTRITKIPEWVLKYSANKYIKTNKPEIKPLIDYLV